MPLVPAKCPECGGNVVVDNEKEAWICDFCKTPFVVEKAINNFNTVNNITNNISADVVNVYESKEKDFVIKAGVLTQYNGSDVVVSIPEGVEEIGRNCFKQASRLRSVILPDTVVVINDSAFEGCVSLESIEFSNSLKYIGEYAFSGCTSLGDIVFPDGLETIKKLAFLDCASITSVSFPNSIKFISPGAFVNTSGIKNVYAAPGTPREQYVRAFPIMFIEEMRELAVEFSSNREYFNVLFDENYEVKSLDTLRAAHGYPEWKKIGAPVANLVDKETRRRLGHVLFVCLRNRKAGMHESFSRYGCTGLGHLVFYALGVGEITTLSNELIDYDVAWVKDYITWETKDEHEARINAQKQQEQEQKKIREKDYIERCLKKSVCPDCYQPLSLFGKCKSTTCPNYCKKIFMGNELNSNVTWRFHNEENC